MKAILAARAKRLLLVILLLPLIQLVHGQGSVPLRDFVIFGRQSATVASSTVEGGAVGSEVLVRTTGGPTLKGNIHTIGRVELSNNTKVDGKITAGPVVVPQTFSGITFQMGTNGRLSRNLYVNGNISIANSTVTGKVIQPAGAQYSGPALAPGQREIRDPNIPALPVFVTNPADSIGKFTGVTNITNPNPQGITPGAYNNVTLGGNRTLRLKGVGKYYFNSINNSGTNTLIFDFENQSGGLIEIYVRGTVNLGKSIVGVQGANASPSRVVIKIYGSGTAFNIAQGNSGGIQWQGTVIAYNGDISIGSGANSSKVLGAMYSNGHVSMGSSVIVEHAPLDPCGLNPNAGDAATFDCDNPTVTLTGTGKPIGNGVTWEWTGEEGGVVDPAQKNLASITVNRAGTYVLTITDANCDVNFNVASDYTVVTFDPCVVPGVIVPPVSGKNFEKIGSELTSLVNSNGVVDEDKNAIFQFHPNDPSKVLIDIICKHGEKSNVYNILAANYGLTASDTLPNGPTTPIITCWYSVQFLPFLNLNSPHPLASKISYVRPVYPAINKFTNIYMGGDSAMRAGIAKRAFNVNGTGVKIGVLSDSYDNLGKAHLDVAAGNLPGPGNPNPSNQTAVQVLRDYPYQPKSDEGRAMLQIIHNSSSGSRLFFRTGFITAGDFAEGIKELAAAGCDVICDDITYITEPFYRNGVVSDAVTEVVGQGKHYVTAAGNFASKSYEAAAFVPSATPVPAGISAPPGSAAHDFGGTIFQRIKVRAQPNRPGIYTIVLQWEDIFYSLEAGSNGSQTDLDLYALDKAGNLIGFNRVNIEGDPTEILTFVVNPKPDVVFETEVDLVVVRTAGIAPVRFKFIVFRGDMTFESPFYAGASTIVGQGNNPGAITVGAVRYTLTPDFGVPNPVVEGFSSTGQGFYNGGTSQKPDLVAPNGVNTSVDMGAGPLGELEGDGIPNFFGTSASAPHVAAALALVMEAKQKFQNATISPADAKSLLQATALDMHAPGFDRFSGAGMMRVYEALKTMANPSPYIAGVEYDQSTPLGSESKFITVHGSFFTNSTVLRVNGSDITTTFVNDKQLTATLPPFTGEKVLTAYTAPISSTLADGGESNPWNLTGVNKMVIRVRAENKTMNFMGALPPFTSRIFKIVNGVEVLVTDPAEINTYGLGTINYTTNGGSDSAASATPYFIRPSRPAHPDAATEALLNEFYTYEYFDGALTIQRLRVKITPVDKTITYGDHIGDFEYTYQILDPVVNQQAAIEYVKASHQAYVASNAVALVEGLTAQELADLNAKIQGENKINLLVTLRALFNARSFDIINNKWVPAADLNKINLFHVVDVNKLAIQNLMDNFTNATVNLYTSAAGNASGTTSRAMISMFSLQNGAAFANRGGGLQQLINAGYMPALLLGENTSITSRVPMLNRRFVHQLDGITSGGGGLVQLINRGGGLQQIINAQLVQLNGDMVTPVPDFQPVVLNDGSIIANRSGGGLVQLINGAGEPLRLFEGGFIDLGNGMELNRGGGLLQLVNGSGFAQLVNTTYGTGIMLDVVPFTDQVTGIANGGGGLAQLINSSTGTDLLDGRMILPNRGGGLLQIVNRGGGLLQLVNRGGGLAQLINRGGGLLQIVNGGLLQLVNHGSLAQIVNSDNYGITSRTATIFDEDDFLAIPNSTPIGEVGPMMGINLITGITPGTHTVVPGAFISDNLLVNSGSGLLNILKANQQITFDEIPAKTFEDAPFAISATASSGLPVSFTVTGPASLSADNILTISGAGAVTITAKQAGNEFFNAAPDVVRIVNVSKANQTITFAALPDVFAGEPPITLVATASSGLPVSFSVSGPATLSGNILTITGTGLVTVTASQAGNANYHPAPSVIRSFNVGTDPCNLTHSTFSSFGSTLTRPTVMWVTVKIKLGGQLSAHGDYMNYTGGMVHFTGISGNFTNPHVIPPGRIEADQAVTAPVTTYNIATGSWLTRVPPGFSTSSDIVIAGAIVYSSNGFTKGKNSATHITGAFRSNRSFQTQWLFSMAAYQNGNVTNESQPTHIRNIFTYSSLAAPNQVVPVNGTYKSGTPVPHIAYVVSGGTGSGGNNYSGNTSNMDNFNPCLVAEAVTKVMQTEAAEPVKEPYFLLAPNPARDQVTVKFIPAVSGYASIRIIHSSGVVAGEAFGGVVKAGQVYNRQIGVSHLAPGLYLVQYVSNGEAYTTKLIIAGR